MFSGDIKKKQKERRNKVQRRAMNSMKILFFSWVIMIASVAYASTVQEKVDLFGLSGLQVFMGMASITAIVFVWTFTSFWMDSKNMFRALFALLADHQKELNSKKEREDCRSEMERITEFHRK